MEQDEIDRLGRMIATGSPPGPDSAPGWWASFAPPDFEYPLSATTVRRNEVVLVTNHSVWHGQLAHDGRPVYQRIAQL